MSSFAKQPICPSSATLLAYAAGTLSFLVRWSVAEHLATCEFCGAESSFWLSLHATVAAQKLPEAHVATAPAPAPQAPAPQIPLSLHLLAKSVLGEMRAAAATAPERRAA